MTMRIMAVKEPMMMPMTSDMVGDMPRSDSIMGGSSVWGSSWGTLHFSLKPFSVLLSG